MRIVIKCSVLLLLGAALTVLAAWGPVVWFGLRDGYAVDIAECTPEEMHWWNDIAPPGRRGEIVHVERPLLTAIGFDFVTLRVYAGFDEMGPTKEWSRTIVDRWQSGLPLHSFGWYRWIQVDAASSQSLARGLWNFDVGSYSFLIPFTPLWFGFAVDTLFFAALAWMALGGWRWVVRRRRLKRGLCPFCTYPIGSSAVCTECGEALPAAAAPSL